ncbi:hypothetical protein [uncultured Paraglaciecola sp.]|nr:hypothetical protein [uncultured Paraglaciecola sp.]
MYLLKHKSYLCELIAILPVNHTARKQWDESLQALLEADTTR